jgi:hypothetical protein
VSQSMVLLGAGILILFWFFLMLEDYSWEKRKCNGLDVEVRSSGFGKQSEQAEYDDWCWIRYPAIILVTFLYSVMVIGSKPQGNTGLVSTWRMIWAFSPVILFSIALIAIDRYLDRRRRGGLSRSQTCAFWTYFWLRYPALILATITATKWGL